MRIAWAETPQSVAASLVVMSESMPSGTMIAAPAMCPSNARNPVTVAGSGFFGMGMLLALVSHVTAGFQLGVDERVEADADDHW